MNQRQEDLISLYNKYLSTSGVCTDTRQITAGCLFFALKGPNFNANAFAEEALEKGAKYAVIDDPEYRKDERFVLVDNALITLQELANYHRSQLTIPVVAITGSNGKTTTKELTNLVLSQKYKVLATKGNLNNHIGVPLTLLSIDPSVELAIIEMGANHLGDIAELCAIAEPTHGLITNIGRAHIGEFGGYENIIRTKSELYHHLIQNDQHVWINSNHDVLKNMSKRFSSPSFYPNEGDHYSCKLLSVSPFITYRSMNGEEVPTHLIGQYNFENIAAALAIGHTFGVDESVANKVIADYQPDNNRSQVIKKESNTYILDAYNANPSSMTAAIENLAEMTAPNKVLILGDMYELGEGSAEEHRKIGELLKSKSFTQVYFCGELIKEGLTTYPDAHFFKDKLILAQEVKRQKYTDTLFLLKASRGIGLEKIIDQI
jgi:UDP-N-acetylmuramoyl-tripeptide--D-alanyl-D-alanine ligase